MICILIEQKDTSTLITALCCIRGIIVQREQNFLFYWHSIFSISLGLSWPLNMETSCLTDCLDRQYLCLICSSVCLSTKQRTKHNKVSRTFLIICSQHSTHKQSAGVYKASIHNEFVNDECTSIHTTETPDSNHRSIISIFLPPKQETIHHSTTHHLSVLHTVNKWDRARLAGFWKNEVSFNIEAKHVAKLTTRNCQINYHHSLC